MSSSQQPQYGIASRLLEQTLYVIGWCTVLGYQAFFLSQMPQELYRLNQLSIRTECLVSVTIQNTVHSCMKKTCFLYHWIHFCTGKKKQAVDVGGFSRWSGLQLSVVSSLVSGDKYFDSAMPCCLFFLKVRKTRTYDREIN